MRGYFFTNMYLSPIQQGIQTAHCVTKLFGESFGTNHQKVMLDYANNHMTKIVLNGGNCSSLLNTFNEIRSAHIEAFDEYVENLPAGRDVPSRSIIGYPYTFFEEDEESLNGAITCVGIILPERVYKFAELIRSGDIRIEVNDKIVTVYKKNPVNIPIIYDIVDRTGLDTLGVSKLDVKLANIIAFARLA